MKNKTLTTLRNWITRCLACMAMLVLCQACSDEELLLQKSQFVFIGDSIIYRWNLDKAFPNLETFNAGKGDQGIEYVEGHEGLYAGKIIVSHFGTNDYKHWINNIEGYADRYLKALKALGGDKAYIISILPRGKKQSANALTSGPIIQKINKELERRCPEFGYVFINVQDALMEGPYFNGEYTDDSIHPNEKGYKIITDIVKPYLDAQEWQKTTP